MPSLVGLGLRAPPGEAKTLSFFVCLSVTLWNDIACANDFVQMSLEYRNDFDVVGERKVCSCAPAFDFLRSPPEHVKVDKKPSCR